VALKKRRMSGRTVETLVGGAAFVLGAIFIAVAFAGGGLIPRAGYTVTAKFRQVDGLSTGSPVHLAGIKVGTVEKLSFDAKTNQAIVRLRLESGVELPEDTSAQVVTDGLLGGKFIKLVPGGAEEMIPPGGHIIYVQNGLIIERLLEKIVINAEANRRELEERLKHCQCGAPPDNK
jgi:phospholipid/cholesterol/gamma-HCH transport system substrate-binding protein